MRLIGMIYMMVIFIYIKYIFTLILINSIPWICTSIMRFDSFSFYS
jgi:hypothetical protein